MVKKKILGIALSIAGIAVVSAVVVQKSTAQKNDNTQVTIGSIGSDAQIWEHIAKLPETKKNISQLRSKILPMVYH
ncbi:hypothetical protein GCM10025879_10680 [Leuconostoc litchii]|nr:hypothetical protein GCM10025879_10680 [Leuconostoc litchii]